MTKHDWRNESPPEKKSGGMIVSAVVWRCRRCCLVAESIPSYDVDGKRILPEQDCDVALVRSVMES